MSQTVYVIRRLSWRDWGDEDFGPAGQSESELSGVPIRVFTSRKAAEAFRREAQEKARRVMSPVRITGFGQLQTQTFVAGVRKLGLEPPETDDKYLYGDELMAWWEEVLPNVNPAIREQVWQLLGDVPLYDIVKTTLED